MFLVRLEGGPVAGERLVHEIRAFWVFNVSSGKYAYYYLVERVKVAKEAEDETNHAYYTKMRSLRARKSIAPPKKRHYQAVYKYSEGQMEEDSETVKVFKNWFNKKYGKT